MKKAISYFLACVLLICSLSVIAPTGEAATYKERYQSFINDSRWANNVSWGDNQTPKSNYTASCIGCAAYAADFATIVYGKNDWIWNHQVSFSSAQDIKSGDIIQKTDNGQHWFIVLERNGNTLYTAEGNYANKVNISNNTYWINGEKIGCSYGSTFRINALFRYENAAPTYQLDVNVYQDGIMHDTGVNCCTFDVTINGSRVANDVKDFCTDDSHPEGYASGTTYKIDDIKINGCYKNNGQTSYSGTITANTKVNLEVVTYHPPKTVAAKAATCTETGLTSGTVCSKCGKVLTAQTTIPAMGHKFTSETIPGSCTEPAKIKYTCTGCGAIKYEYTGDGTYGDWTATEPSVSGSTVIETKTQYKSREKDYKESTLTSLSGYTLRTDKEPKVDYSAYGNWSAWTPGSMSGSDTREVENKVIYRYYAFVCPNCGQRDPYKGACSKCGYNLTSAHSAIIWSSIAYKNSNSYEYLVSAKRATKAIDGAVWIFNTEDLNKTNPGMYSSEASAVLIDNGYRYHDRTKTTTYYYEKWSDWSDWSDMEVKASDTVEVQTRTLYRTFTPAVGGSHTWNSGVITTPATCTSEGVKTYTCTVCTATKTETIAKLNHNYTNKADAKYLKSAATETSAAVYYKSCSVCGAKGTETFTFGDPVPPAVDTDTVLAVSSAKTMAGKEITLTLALEKNPGAAGLSVSLNYDTSALTLKSATNGTLFTSFTSGKNFIFDNASNVTSDGTVATFIFTVNDNAAAGDYTVTPIVRSCVNDGGEDVAVKTEKGTVTVIDFIYGNANDDEMIDMKDVVLLRRYLAEFDYETNSSPVEIGFGADANGDGTIDMKDVVLLRKYLANYDYETNTSTEVLGPQ